MGELRREIVAFAADHGACRSARDAVALAVSEAVTNAVLHGYAGRDAGHVLAEARCDGDGHLIVVVCDDGHGMIPRTDSPGLGLGMSLMAQMADDFRICDRPDAGGTRVALRFALDGSTLGT